MPDLRPTDFSNESFEAFEELLRRSALDESSLGWQLRDMAFSALYHDPPTWQRIRRSRNAIFAIPEGWIPWLYSYHLAKRFTKIPSPAPPSDHHFLCLSARSNHIQRIVPEAATRSSNGSCTIWVTNPKAAQALQGTTTATIRGIDHPWAPFLDPTCIEIARTESARILNALPPVSRPAAAKLAVSLAIYQAALPFWRENLSAIPKSVLTTYEKDPLSKAMLTAAAETGVSERIHWTHGLRHSSQRVTLANQLWCLTSTDARYFQPKLPPGSTAIHRPSPESIHWLKNLGPLPPEILQNPPSVHFLVLGSGFDPGYTLEMSLADLRVIATARDALGPRVQWRFRPHPGNIQRFRDDLSKVGLHDIDFSTRTLAEDLQWSHAVGSTFSSVAMDIEPTGRPIFWILAEIRPLYSVDQMIADGYGTHLDAATAAAKIREIFHLK